MLINKIKSIRARILLLVVMPIILVSLILSYYLMTTRIGDTKKALSKEGELISSYLATAAEYGLYTGNSEMLQNLVNYSTKGHNVSRITIFNVKGVIVAQSVHETSKGTKFDNLFRDRKSPRLISFSKPIYETGINVFDYQEAMETNPTEALHGNKKQIGSIEVKLSTHTLLLQHKTIFKNSVIIAIISLIIGAFLSFQTEKSITQPILKLTRMMSAMRGSEYGARVDEKSSGDLGALEKGFNTMASILEKNHVEMKKRVDNATSELKTTIQQLESKNTELDLARTDALRAGRAKEEFLARMSHEIRTPMNAVIGYTKLLSKTDQDREQKEFTRVIDTSAHQLLTVIDDVLNFTKLEAGSVELEKITFDIQDYMEDVIGMLSHATGDKGLELVLLIYSDVPTVIEGDPIRINQILINFINNAIKFTSEGGIVVHVEKLEDLADQSVIKFSVVDTGIGVNEEDTSRLFEEFSQADSSITRRFGGTGLGLAIAKRYVELMGGQIGVESKPGDGSKFWFTVLCKQDVEQNTKMSYDNLRNKKILVYDSNQFSMRSIRNNLIKWNVNVYTARRITKVIEMLGLPETNNDITYDAVILGLSVEELGSSTLLRIHREIRSIINVPLLLLLSSESYSLPALLEQDAQVQLKMKPIRRQKLYRSLCELLKIESQVDIDSWNNNTDLYIKSGKKVLVIEDNKFNRDLIASMLVQKKLVIYLAKNAEEAIEIVKNIELDLILADIHLPDMSGMEVANIIRNDYKRKYIPIVALTADVFFADKNNVDKTLFDDCILKPISEKKFWDIVSKWLNEHVTQDRNESKGINSTHVNNTNSHSLICLAEPQKKMLKNELLNLLGKMEEKSLVGEYDNLPEYYHQLKGLVGYYGLWELEEKIVNMERQSLINTNLLSLNIKEVNSLVNKL